MPAPDRHRRVAIDSNVLVYLLEDDAELGEAAATVVDAVAAGSLEGVLSCLAIAETLVGPARANDATLFELAAATIRDLGFEIVGLDADVAQDAAWIRGRTGIGLADAVHLASAARAGATALVTNDARLGGARSVEVVDLAGFAAELRASSEGDGS